MRTLTLINWFGALVLVSASAVTSAHAGGLLGDLVGQVSPEAGKLVDSYSAQLQKRSSEQGNSDPPPVSPQH